MAQSLDPKNINGRLYDQLAKLLDDMEAADRDEKMTMPQRINCLIAIGRVQVIFSNLRKASVDDPGHQGSTVRKYAAAFRQTNATRRGAAGARPALSDPVEPGDDPGPDEAA